MRIAKVLFKDEKAGLLIQNDDGSFIFRYHNTWLENASKPSLSLTLPKIKQEYHSKYLFSFFYNMLPEGSNKDIVCKSHRIDHDDDFGLLMTSAKDDSIGAVRIIKIEDR
jgi:HipA-like protein